MQNYAEQPKLFESCRANSIESAAKYIHINEATAVTKPCTGTGHNIADCRYPELEECISDVGSLSLMDIHPGSTEILPRYIPIINDSFFSFPASKFQYEVIGLNIKHIIETPQKPKIIIDILNQPIFKNKRVILFASGKDALIEKLWRLSTDNKYFETMGEMGFYTATSVNFSLYEGECPIGHALNMKKTLVTLNIMQQSGLPCIPHTYWINEYQLERWIEWLLANPQIHTVTINCQCYKTGEEHASVTSGIMKILKKVPRPIHFLLEGPKQNLLKRLTGISDLIHVAILFPSISALNSTELTSSKQKLEPVNAYGQKSVEQLLTHNNLEYEKFLKNTLYSPASNH